MPIITLTSDWGLKDHYVGAVKGNILKRMPEATIVDISHSITPFDLTHAAFVIKNVYHDFPDGTIHIIDINSEASQKTPHTVVYAEKQYFVSADNGIFSLIFDKQPDKIVEIDIIADSGYFTFSARDVFAKAAVMLAQGKKIEELGPERTSFNRDLISFQPVVDEQNNVIRGQIVYIDAYENLITNISADIFREVGKNRKFSIFFRNPRYTLHSIKETYDDEREGEMLAIFGSGGYLEIALNRGNAAGLLGMELSDSVRVEFSEK